MKKNWIWILKMAVYYSILGFILQGILVNLLFAAAPVSGQDLKDIRPNINITNGTLEQVFRAIEENTDFRFIYVDKEIPLSQKVNAGSSGESLYSILETLAIKCAVSFHRIDNQIVVKKTIKTPPPEKFTLSGTVYDSNTQEPIIFANILINELGTGVTSDDKGNFKLILASGSYRLQVSYIGYKTELVDVLIEKMDQSILVPMIRTDVLLQEVSIYSKAADTSARGTTSSVTLQSKRIEQISGPLPDVFRSIQMLPGIAVDNEYSAKFNVRGGNYDENLVIINGTQVYEPFHLKEASNASIGIFNINLMNNVEMMTGGFSAMYGDRMSSVLNIEYREGSRERYKGTATLSLTDLNLTAEGPLTSNGSFLFAVRKSYLEYAMSMVGAQSYEKPSFYDVQGIFSYSLSPSNKLLFKFIRSGDNFTNTPGPSSSQRSGLGYFQNNWSSITQVTNSYDEDDGLYYNNLLDLQDISILSGKAILKTSLSYYEQVDKVHHLDSTYFRNDITSAVKYFYLSHYTDKYDDDLNIRTLEAKITLEDQITPYYEIRSGFNYQNIQYNQNLTSVWIQNIYQNIDKYPDLSTFFYSNQPAGYTAEKINASSYKLAGYLENVVQIDKNFIFNAGGRIDYFDINKDLNLSPRLSLSYKTNFGMIIRTAWGFYYQSPIYNQLISAVASDTNTQAQKATHYILGIEDSFSLSETGNQTLTIKAEGFLKKYNQLISSSTDSYGRITYSRKNDSEGHTAGFDIYSVLNVRGFYGWLCYEYLTSKEYYISDPSPVYSRSTDQTHTLSIVTDFDLGVKWDLNIRATYGSGFAYTPYTAVYNSKNLQWNWEAGIKNSAKLPAYRRVDVRVSKELSVWSLKADLFLDVSNLFNFENVQGYSYRFDNNGYPETNEIKLWPILPSFGFTIHF